MSEISESQRIENDLDQTRSRLDGHLDELQDRFSPGQVLDDLMKYFRGSEGADFGRSLLDNVRANPLPAAVTGIGLAWLMATNPRSGAAATGRVQANAGLPAGSNVRVFPGTPSLQASGFRQGGHEEMSTRLRRAEQEVAARGPGEAEPAYTARLDAARGQAVGLMQHAQESAQSFSQRISDAVASAQEALTRGAHDLQDQARGVAGSVGDAARGVAQRAGGAATQGGQLAGQAGGGLMSSLVESPVLLGALGLAAGALLGALLPQSDQEEAALGGVAGQARDTVRGLAQEAVDRGGQIAQAVLDKGHDSAEAHGLTGTRSPGELVDAAMSGELATGVRQVAGEALQAGDGAAREPREAPPSGSPPG